jgi:hypothetical protein
MRQSVQNTPHHRMPSLLARRIVHMNGNKPPTNAAARPIIGKDLDIGAAIMVGDAQQTAAAVTAEK